MHVSEHANRSRQEYGDECLHVHKWLDACFEDFHNVFHRDVRHNASGVDFVFKKWGDAAKKIAIQHIIDDCGCVPICGFYHCEKYGADQSTKNLVSMLAERTFNK